MTRRALPVTLVVIALLAGCGVRTQSEPEPIDPTEIPFGLLTERAGTETGASEIAFVVYLVRGERLVAVPRVGMSPATPELVLDVLLFGATPDEAAAGLRSALPSGASLRSVQRTGATVVVDLDATFAESGELDMALRQIEATLRELPGVDVVLVSPGGVLVQAQPDATS